MFLSGESEKHGEKKKKVIYIARKLSHRIPWRQ